MKNNKFCTVRTDPKFNQIIVDKDKFNAANAHIHDLSLDWLRTGTSKMWQGGTSFMGIKIIFCTIMYLFDDIK